MRSAMVEALTLTTESTTPRAAEVEPPAVWTSAQWVAYFLANRDNLLGIPWEDGPGAPPEELAPLLASLRAWQLGESSDGAKFLAIAEQYATRSNDPDYFEAIKLFIAEEQRHGATLGRFLDLAGTPRKTWDLGDSIFRVFRHFLSRMESCATVIVMAEVHAMLYYAAIRRATTSPLLKRVCEQLLRDEVPHIRFQCERLAILHRTRGRIGRWLTTAAHRVLFTGITMAIWVGHRRALRAGGFTFGRFWRNAWSRMRNAWRAMDPKAYRWSAEGCGNGSR